MDRYVLGFFVEVYAGMVSNSALICQRPDIEAFCDGSVMVVVYVHVHSLVSS